MAGGPALTMLDVDQWSDASSRDALDLVATAVSELDPFGLAVIAVVRGDLLHVVSAEGREVPGLGGRGEATPVATVLSALQAARPWGPFLVVPEHASWCGTALTVAALVDADKAFLGILAVDVPAAGLPGDVARGVLHRHAGQAERALQMAVERHALADRIRVLDTARDVMRLATSHDDLQGVIDRCRQPLLDGFQADWLALRTYPTQDLPAAGTPTTDLPLATIQQIRDQVHLAWAQQRVILAGSGEEPVPPGSRALLVDPAAYDVVRGAARHLSLGAVMVVPLGAGRQCLGHLVLGRTDPHRRFNHDEQVGALDLTRDIGQAIASYRSLAREQRLVEDLKRLSSYKTEVLNTVSHELRNPLGAVTGHLELLESGHPLSETARRSVEGIGRAASRMSRVVEDLLLLARMEDPAGAVTHEAVDVGAVLRDVVDRAHDEGHVAVELPAAPVHVCCSVDGLDRVLTNLVGNALRYAGSVRVGVTEHGDEVEIAVADRGIGISAADQTRLFTEFFRSTNPEALARSGTGLGLTTCRRIVEQHGGTIDVESTLGVGSTFRVRLPAEPAPAPASQSG